MPNTHGSIRVGIIGCGVIGQRMAQNMSEHDGFTVIKAYDHATEARQKFVSLFPDITTCDSSEPLFNKADIDLLYIGTPPLAHAEYALRAAEQNLFVFCEKPLGVNQQTSQDLISKMGSKPHGMNFVYSGAPAMHRAREVIHDGVLGTVIGADINIAFSKWPRGWQENAGWLSQRDQGGFVREVGSHFAYLTHLLLGTPRLEHPPLLHAYDDPGCEYLVQAQWETASGPVSFFGRAGGCRTDIVQMRILGTKACLLFDQWYQLYKETDQGLEPMLQAEEATPKAAYHGQLNGLQHQYWNQEKRLADFVDGLRVQDLVEDMLKPLRGSDPHSER